MQRNLIVTALVAVLMAGFVLAYRAVAPASAQPTLGMAATGLKVSPPVKGYLDGQEIRFIHTEVSDPKVAEKLTTMTRSPVLVVPALAQAPAETLATVYVFTNGLKGGGPLGFQPDVFDRPPGDPGYSPLRALNLVTWKDESAARVLTSAAEVQAAVATGEATVARPGVVVNMPLVTWPGGGR